MRRREFIVLLGRTAAMWPLAAHSQQVIPVIGFLHAGSPDQFTEEVAAFRKALGEAGFIEGRDATIEYRWAQGQYGALPTMASDLVSHHVAVIAAIAPPAVAAAKAATSEVPIVFLSGVDPVEAGLVDSIKHPGGNVTGVSTFTSQVEPKKLELLHEMIPAAVVIAVLINPNNPNSGAVVRNLESAAQTLGLPMRIFPATTEQEIDVSFAELAPARVGALVVVADPLFFGLRRRLASLALNHAVPTVFEYRDFVVSGGLMSYGSNLITSFRQLGQYAGRVLKGEKPNDLPILQPTKFELVINQQTAKALGIKVPPTLLALADEVIE